MDPLMNNIFIALICFTLITACAKSAPEPEDYEIVNQQLRTKTDEQGSKLFSYRVTVKAGSQAILKKNSRLTKSDIKKLLEQENFIDSSSLKMDLEDKAAKQLELALKEKDYCSNGYSIEEVKWRDYSVRLSGRCDD
jgi:hypothetical protein